MAPQVRSGPSHRFVPDPSVGPRLWTSPGRGSHIEEVLLLPSPCIFLLLLFTVPREEVLL